MAISTNIKHTYEQLNEETKSQQKNTCSLNLTFYVEQSYIQQCQIVFNKEKETHKYK